MLEDAIAATPLLEPYSSNSALAARRGVLRRKLEFRADCEWVYDPDSFSASFVTTLEDAIAATLCLELYSNKVAPAGPLDVRRGVRLP